MSHLKRWMGTIMVLPHVEASDGHLIFSWIWLDWQSVVHYIFNILDTVKLLNSPPSPPLKSGHSSTMAKFSLHWRILKRLLPSRAATPEFPTTDCKNDQITPSNNFLKFKKNEKKRQRKLSTLYDLQCLKLPFAPTSNDLNIIVCDSKAVKWSFLLQLRQSFWSILNPKW